MFEYPIAISLSPNTQKEDVWQALKTLFQPWNWQKGEEIEKVEKWFKDYFHTEEAVSFNSGRSALYAILKASGIGQGDEVILQAFTCVAVPDPIIWTGAKPIFVDIEETLNIDPSAIEKHISRKTKAIIVQHTFGIPAKIELIKKIAQKYNLILIEDCAHSLGATINGKKIGSFGDFAFFSFGRDKVISSVFGGMAIINGKLKIENGKLREFQKQIPFPGYSWILQQVLHPIVFNLIVLPFYNFFGIGKIILKILQTCRFLSFPVYQEEKEGRKPDVFPAKYPNALARILILQLQKLESYNQKRKEIAIFYHKALVNNQNIKLPKEDKGAIDLRYNLLTNKAESILANTKKGKIIWGNWYRNILDPKGVLYEKIGYQKGSCPKAEQAAKLSINLPTYPRLTSSNLNTIVNLIKKL